MPRLVTLLAGLLALAAASPAAAQDPGAAPPPVVQDPGLRPGDVVRVTIWREPDLSGEFVVDEHGQVVFPMIGVRRVTGLSLDSLRSGLLRAYEAHLRNPSINIVPLRRIHVLGEVHRPGLYPVDPTVSLAGAVSLAGGATSSGDLRRIRIVRGGTVIRDRVGTGETLTGADIRSGDQILVERRSWFDRNSTFIVSGLLSLTSIVVALTR